MKKPIGKADYVSEGSVFDGSALVAVMSHSRYLSVKLPPGVHTFSASKHWARPDMKEPLKLDLRPGTITYLAVTQTVNNYGGLWAATANHITAVSCEAFITAHTNDNSELVPDEKMGDAYLALRDTSGRAFQCAP